MSGYVMFLGDNVVFWSAKRQTVASRFSTEAEYRAVANGVADSTWLRQLLHELQTPSSRCTLAYCDNISTVYLSTNPVHHQHTKHMEIDLHFVREKVVIQSSLRPPCPDNIAVYRYLHEGAHLLGI
jgi:hypothetical protein